MESTKETVNYVFYVSDMDVLPDTGHFRKMDAGREIAEHICLHMENSRLLPYTEYDGELLQSGSIGIVFPTHMWGISLAVYAFLQHLRVKTGAYVYAVAVGESLSEAVNETLGNRIKPLEQFRKIFTRHGFGTDKDIFVRCIDRKRNVESTEDYMVGCTDGKKALKHIMRGLLFHNLKELSVDTQVKNPALTAYDIYDIRRNRAFDVETNNSETVKVKNMEKQRIKKTVLENVFLDDELLSGVKLCRVM